MDLAALLRFPLGPKKTPVPAATVDILGIEVAMLPAADSSAAMWMRPDAKKLIFWADQVQAALDAGSLTMREAAKLAGRLSFGVSAVWGEAARRRLRSLFRRSVFGRPKISDQLRRDLTWRSPFLRHPIQRPRPLRPLSLDMAAVYTDAGGLGAVAITSTTESWCSARAPESVLRRLAPRRHRFTLMSCLRSLSVAPFAAGEFCCSLTTNRPSGCSLRERAQCPI